MKTEKNSLRKEMQLIRQNLSFTERNQAQWALTHQLLRLPILLKAKRIACYLAMGAELSLEGFMHHPHLSKQFFVPTLHPAVKNRLLAQAWHPNAELSMNALKFLTLQHPKDSVPWWTLDLILVPLLAFDKKGARLGRGGGFYDILIDELNRFSKKPFCIGIAYDFQEVVAVPTAAHDAYLDGIITPTRWIKTN